MHALVVMTPGGFVFSELALLLSFRAERPLRQLRGGRGRREVALQDFLTVLRIPRVSATKQPTIMEYSGARLFLGF